jgi:hypothetical protein
LIPAILPGVPEIRDDQVDPAGPIFIDQAMEGTEFKERLGIRKDASDDRYPLAPHLFPKTISPLPVSEEERVVPSHGDLIFLERRAQVLSRMGKKKFHPGTRQSICLLKNSTPGT